MTAPATATAISAAAGTPDPPAGALTLDEAERGFLGEEVERFLAALATPEARRRFRPLAAAVAAGEVAGEDVGALEGLLEIALGSGEVRRFHGPAGEQALAALFARTPRGAAQAEQLRAVNRALEAVHGQPIERLAFGAGLPGTWQLVVETDRCRLRFEIDRHGVRGKDLEVGG